MALPLHFEGKLICCTPAELLMLGSSIGAQCANEASIEAPAGICKA